MLELTDRQKADCHKIIDAMVSYWWTELKVKMLIEGLSFEAALEAVKFEILKDA